MTKLGFTRKKYRTQGIKKVHSVVVLLVLLIGCVTPVFAQEQTGSIEGVVSDEKGGRIAGAIVKVEGSGGAFTRIVTTGDDGFFRVLQIPVGTYKISVNAKNFAQWSTEDVKIVLGKAVGLEVQLKTAGSAETVTVTSGGEVIKLDPTDNKIQTNIPRSVIEALPTGTNFTSLLKISPATRPEPLSGQFQIDGASGSENTFIIDGQEVGNFRTGVLNANNNIPLEFVQEIQIKTSGFEAQFGGATGGVVNVVTRSGGNSFHGGVGMQFENDQLFADNRPFLQSFRSGTGAAFVQINEYLTNKKDDFNNLFPSGTLGGPIIKDRVWFLLSYAPQFFKSSRETNYFTSDPRTRTRNATTPAEVYRFRQRNDYALGRVDGAITDNLRVSGTYTWNPISQHGSLPQANINIGGSPPSANFGGTTGILTGHRLTDLQGGRQNSNNITTQATWTPTGKIVGTFRYSRGFLNEKLGSYQIPNETRFICGGLAPPTSAGCTQGFSNISSNRQNNFDISVRNNFEGDVSYLGSFAGRHELKGGYQYSKLTNDVSNSNNTTTGEVQLSYGFTINDVSGVDPKILPPTPGAIGAGLLFRFGRVGLASNTAQSLYIQDKWQPVHRLSINAGVRFEKEDLPSFNSFAPPINFGWGDKIVPRLGFAYDVSGDGKSKIFASYGRFTDRLKFELPRGSFGGEFFRNDYFEILPANPRYDFYTFSRVLGTNVDKFGGTCPIPGSTGLTRCQLDFRIASNNPGASIEDGKVDPKLKPFSQTEFTVGYERQLSENYLFRGRYTYKNVTHAIEDAGFPNSSGSEAYIIGNPGSGLHLQTAKDYGFVKVATPQRRYDAMELVLDRRLKNKYYFNLNYTYSRLYGNYSGLASSDENGRTSPGVNRFFDLPFAGFTIQGDPDNGRLPTDRPHVFNAFGGYDFNWWGNNKNTSHFSFFTTAQSGTPMTTFVNFYSVSQTILNRRGDLGRTPAFTQTDFSIAHKVKMGEGRSLTFDFTVVNLFNQDTVTFVQRTFGAVTLGGNLGLGDEPTTINKLLTGGVRSQVDAYLNDPTHPERKQTSYGNGFPTTFQGPRQMRLGLRFVF